MQTRRRSDRCNARAMRVNDRYVRTGCEIRNPFRSVARSRAPDPTCTPYVCAPIILCIDYWRGANGA
jgi:hypothetical protein